MSTTTLESRGIFNPFEDAGLKVRPTEVLKSLGWIADTQKKSVSVQAAIWFVQVETFHRSEDTFLASGLYENFLPDHRVALCKLISDGEMLVRAAQKIGLADDAPFKLRDLEAAVETLHSAFHAQHRNGSTEETRTQVAAMFPDEE